MEFLINVYGIVQQKMVILLFLNIKVQMVNLTFFLEKNFDNLFLIKNKKARMDIPVKLM
jgi:hypothetical protein